MDKRYEKIIEDAQKWLATKEGQDSLFLAMKEAEEKGRQFSECRQIDAKLLNEPFTI